MDVLLTALVSAKIERPTVQQQFQSKRSHQDLQAFRLLDIVLENSTFPKTNPAHAVWDHEQEDK
jgi:hypothetical protein